MIDSGGNVIEVFTCNCSVAKMLPGEVELVSARGGAKYKAL